MLRNKNVLDTKRYNYCKMQIKKIYKLIFFIVGLKESKTYVQINKKIEIKMNNAFTIIIMYFFIIRIIY